jgi:polyhydroxyalkanoate synthesis regulator phasin
MDETEQVMKLVDDLGDPKYMSKTEWKEFLQDIIQECRMRIEAADEF